jgi:hypothetical protein
LTKPSSLAQAAVYGPLAFLLVEGRRTWQDLLDALGKESVFLQGEPLPKYELELWMFWIDHDFFPRNEQMKQLLMENTHLIEGDRLPDSYLKFLDHYNSWKIKHLRWKEADVAYEWHSKTNWPEDFENEVINTFESLKQRHSRFLAHQQGSRR